MEEFEEILKLSSKQELEKAGSTLDLIQAHRLFLLLKEEKLQAAKFLPLLVGMNQSIFYRLLETISPEEEILLKEFGGTEPLLHKLAILSHDWREDLEALVKNVYEVAAKIEGINLSQLTKREIFAKRRMIDELDSLVETHIFVLNFALSIAWNSKRIDIIDSLSTLKDLYLRTSSILVGRAKTETNGATGLFKKLEDRLNQVYSAPLNEDDPAIEALTSFGIFYVEDYIELGLVPAIRSVKELKNHLKQNNIQELNGDLEAILEEVENTLRSLGLTNVKAFKDAKIYSKDLLKEYITTRLAAK